MRASTKGMPETGPIGRELCSNSYGRFITRCQAPGVGRSRVWGRFKATDWFHVVTDRRFNGECYEYDVVTAYPAP